MLWERPSGTHATCDTRLERHASGRVSILRFKMRLTAIDPALTRPNRYPALTESVPRCTAIDPSAAANKLPRNRTHPNRHCGEPECCPPPSVRAPIRATPEAGRATSPVRQRREVARPPAGCHPLCHGSIHHPPIPSCPPAGAPAGERESVSSIDLYCLPSLRVYPSCGPTPTGVHLRDRRRS